MKFSLVLTCLNEMRSLPQWRADLDAQSRQPDEIVIVDAVSKDGTTQALLEWASQDSRVRVKVEKCSAARGHNIGNEMAGHDVIVSTDFGTRLDSRWFEEIVRPFEEDPATEIVAGSYAIEFCSLQSAVARAEYYLENGGVPVFGPGFIPGNRSMAYTKKVWRELGGLPEDLTLYADDSVFGRQMVAAGYKMAFAPKAVVYWRRPSRLRQFWKEQFNYGRGDGEANIKVPFACRWHAHGWIPAFMAPPLTGMRTMTKELKFRAVAQRLARATCLRACAWRRCCGATDTTWPKGSWSAAGTARFTARRAARGWRITKACRAYRLSSGVMQYVKPN